MLKQVFDVEQLSKILSSSDVWRWNLLADYGDVKTAIDHTVNYWQSNKMSLSLLNKNIIKNKSVFKPEKWKMILQSSY